MLRVGSRLDAPGALRRRSDRDPYMYDHLDHTCMICRWCEEQRCSGRWGVNRGKSMGTWHLHAPNRHVRSPMQANTHPHAP